MSNADIVTDYMAKVDNDDPAGAQRHFAPGFEFVTPFGPVTEREGHSAMVNGFNTAFPDMRHVIDEAWEQGDVVFVEGTWHGMNTGPFTLPDGTVVPAT